MMRAASLAAEALGVEPRPIEIGGVGAFESALPGAASMPTSGFVTTDHPIYNFNAAALAAIAEKLGLRPVGAPVNASPWRHRIV